MFPNCSAPLPNYLITVKILSNHDAFNYQSVCAHRSCLLHRHCSHAKPDSLLIRQPNVEEARRQNRARRGRNSLHKDKEVGTPRMGGVVIWTSALLTTLIFSLASIWWPESETLGKLNFFSRNQTWLPLFTLLIGSLVGLVDDYLQIKRSRESLGGGLPFIYRAAVVVLLGALGGWWFYSKLDVDYLMVPFVGELFVGWLIIPVFIAVMLGLFSSGVVDGLDGLAGGIMAIIFSAYAAIALGAKAVEKHFTLSRKQKGPDHFISLEPPMLKELVGGIRKIEAALKNGKIISKEEYVVRDWAFHSVVADRNIKAGEKITLDNVRPARPGRGIPAKYLDPLYSGKIIGKTVKRNLPKSAILQWSDLA